MGSGKRKGMESIGDAAARLLRRLSERAEKRPADERSAQILRFDTASPGVDGEPAAESPGRIGAHAAGSSVGGEERTNGMEMDTRPTSAPGKERVTVLGYTAAGRAAPDDTVQADRAQCGGSTLRGMG